MTMTAIDEFTSSLRRNEARNFNLSTGFTNGAAALPSMTYTASSVLDR